MLDDATLVIDGTLFRDNDARGGRSSDAPGLAGGGAVYASGSVVSIHHAHFEGNSAAGGSCVGGIFPVAAAFGGALQLVLASDFDVADSVLVDNLAAGGESDVNGGSGLGGALAIDSSDGGCPPTVALGSNSPALDGGSCAVSGLTTDARGVARPKDHPAVGNVADGCDVGAFELHPGSRKSAAAKRSTAAPGPLIVPWLVEDVAAGGVELHPLHGYR